VRVYRCVRGSSHHSLFWTQPCQSTPVQARARPANPSNHPHNVRAEPSSLTRSGSPSHRRIHVAAVGFRANEEEEGFSSKISDLLDIGQSTKSGFVKRWVPCPPLWVGMIETAAKSLARLVRKVHNRSMPRTARVSVGGLCYHARNRGNQRPQVFHDRAPWLRPSHLPRLVGLRASAPDGSRIGCAAAWPATGLTARAVGCNAPWSSWAWNGACVHQACRANHAGSTRTDYSGKRSPECPRFLLN
jgi:hypothetical protein